MRCSARSMASSSQGWCTQSSQPLACLAPKTHSRRKWPCRRGLRTWEGDGSGLISRRGAEGICTRGYADSVDMMPPHNLPHACSTYHGWPRRCRLQTLGDRHVYCGCAARAGGTFRMPARVPAMALMAALHIRSTTAVRCTRLSAPIPSSAVLNRGIRPASRTAWPGTLWAATQSRRRPPPKQKGGAAHRGRGGGLHHRAAE